jgi:excinuclease ABC subunit C
MEKKKFTPSMVPAKPGVYIFRDRFGKVIYIGKAANLRKRMSHYFQPSRMNRADPKQRSLLNSIFEWEFQSVKNEDESLLLESRLIKEYAPRYNVLMRDDKRFLLVKINLNEPLPRLIAARVRKDDGARYWGPFPKGTALRQTIDFLTAWFKLRACSPRNPDVNTHKHCLKKIVKDCCEPCVGKVTREEYMERVSAMIKVLDGNLKELLDELNVRMAKQAAAQRFEQAARIRDIIINLKAVFGVGNRNFRFARISDNPGIDAVKDLQEALNLKELPNLIEGFDISNIGGTLAVGSMVCFQNGRPAPKQYRRFRIREVTGSDDFAMMREVIHRHYGRKIKENQPMPGLLMVDGGKGQLSAALTMLDELECPLFPVIGLAKKQEEIFIPGRSESLILDRHRPALRLLQALRDEAHRFAVSYHRELRDKRLQESLLDEVPGIGPERKRKILIAFGSIRKLRAATPEQIAAKVPGIGRKFAETIVECLKRKR